jgi:hypothetical protein
MDYADYFRQFQAEHSDLAADLAIAKSLESVMAWMRRRGLDLASVEIIQQDEYSLDFVIPLSPSGRYLVFGIT